MNTVINNPGENKGDGMSGGAGVLIGAIIVIVVLVVVLILTLPYIRERINSMSQPVKPIINVQLPNLPNITISTTTIR